MMDKGNTNSIKMNKKAAEFRQLIEDYFIDEQGLLRCNVNKTTLKPFTDKELEPYEITSQGSSKVARWTYEDTFFVSGLYLWSLVEEYKCTQEAECLAKANVFFDNLYCLVKKSFDIDRGFIGKPWGGYPSRETTLDQTFYLCMGLHAYIDVADSTRKQIAENIIIENTDWWVRREYCNFQTPQNVTPVWLKRSHIGGMLGQVYLAYIHSGDDKFLSEVQKLIDTYQADLFLTRKSSQWLNVDKDGLKVRRIALWHHALGLALWLLNNKWPERSAYWKERLASQWNEELKLGLRPNGLAYQCVRVSLKDGKEVPFGMNEAGFLGEQTKDIKNNHAQGWLWVGALESGCTAAHIGLSAALTADAAKWMKSETTDSLKTVITKLTANDMTRAYDPDGKQCFEFRKHWLDSLSSKGIAAWLLTYWFSKRAEII